MKRDLELEHELIEAVALSIGQARRVDGVIDVDPQVSALNSYAETRAWPGDVIVIDRPVPLFQEAAEELADARSYLLWIIQDCLAAAEAGDGDASERYGRAMRALSHILEAWSALTTV